MLDFGASKSRLIKTMKSALGIGWLLMMPALLFGAGITVQVGGSSCSPVICVSYPIFYPAYSYYGYGFFPNFYAGPVPGYSYSSSSGVGRTIRLGEEHNAFWDKHGGFEPISYNTVESQPLVKIAVIDRRSPLEVGDSESRILDLDLGVGRIIASGNSTVYFLTDGRKVTAEQGVILEIAQR